jgi:penicillin-insensitive murein endopeptidase
MDRIASPVKPAANAVSRSLNGSVGARGVNRREDVQLIQRLLNQAGAGLKEDGNCGPTTVAAIEDYQCNWTARPDGLVSVGGITWQNLLQGRLKIKRQGYIQLPQAASNNYYPYSTSDRQFATPATVQTLLSVAAQFAKEFPGLKIGIGDMSFVHGTPMSPHKTHRNGRNADIRPIRTDGKALPVKISDLVYSRERTKRLVEILRANQNVASILFNDTAIPGVKSWVGHDNHLHVSTRS